MNGFKAINDDYSHTEGDEALKNMSGILFKVVSGEGNVIRLTTEEDK
ncbi:MAG: GGDEF domain-containing protein [Lachnospiraceae bacterium]|nr:GGDEF domain-containing protein [Lachnospiraceae bacterium]